MQLPKCRAGQYSSVCWRPELEAEIERLRDLLAWNGINPDAIVESAKGAAQKRK